jgi:hypothetical protein
MKTYPESYHATVRTTCSAFVDLAAADKTAAAQQLLTGADIPYAHFMFYLIRTYMGSEEERMIELANTAYGKPRDYDFYDETNNLFG